MNNAIQMSVGANNDCLDRGEPNHTLRYKFTADCESLRTPRVIGLPLREIGPVGRRLMLERRQRDAALDVAREMFEQAYVCALLEIESFVSQPLENDDEIARTIDLIEEARRSRADDPHVVRADDLLIVYGRPTIAQVRKWRTRHSRSQVVADHRFPNLPNEGIRDRDDLLCAISGNLIWRRLWRAFEKAFAECVRSVDPSIDWSSSDAEIWCAINRVSLERRLGAHFKPSQLRDWL
jgi:hypothetical protein